MSDLHLGQVRETQSMRISLLGPDDPSTENRTSRSERWRDYVNTYVLKTPTEWVPASRGGESAVYLRR